MEGEDFYTVEQAAKVLRLSPGRIRQMLRAGELEGLSPEQTGGRGWKIPMHAVHDRDRPPRVERPPESPGASEKLSELEAEVRDLRYQLGLSEGRLELTEKAESTLRDSLERERERADQAELEAQRLRAALEEARKPEPPWWRKLFGS